MDETQGSEFRRRQYRNPPVVEAIARVHLAAALPWSITTPGRIYSILENGYPGEPDTQQLVEPGVSPAGSSAGLSVRSGAQRLVLRNDSADRLIVVGPEDISVHGLVPYEGWESLVRRLEEALEHLRPLLGDTQFSDIGVRYVNSITIPESQFDFTKYFTIGFTMPPGFPHGVSAFMDRVECTYPEGDSRIAFTWASTQAPEGSSAFLVDMDLNAARVPTSSVDEVLQGLHLLKKKETEAFESLLQDELRKLFDEIG